MGVCLRTIGHCVHSIDANAPSLLKLASSSHHFQVQKHTRKIFKFDSWSEFSQLQRESKTAVFAIRTLAVLEPFLIGHCFFRALHHLNRAHFQIVQLEKCWKFHLMLSIRSLGRVSNCKFNRQIRMDTRIQNTQNLNTVTLDKHCVRFKFDGSKNRINFFGDHIHFAPSFVSKSVVCSKQTLRKRE